VTCPTAKPACYLAVTRASERLPFVGVPAEQRQPSTVADAAGVATDERVLS
jgi:hypothetical protein